MATFTATSGLQLQSLVKADGELEVSVRRVPIAEPGPDEVIIEVQAAPINPSDLGLLFGPADLATLRPGGTPEEPVITAVIPAHLMKTVQSRTGEAMVVGNEGAGLVVQAGAAPRAQALLGRTVAAFGGGMYAQYRCAKAAQCVALPEGITAAEGASLFVNPLTALCMIDTLRREGHTALVHTAAASNLGQMLNRICLQDGIGLVNIVRNAAQEKLLRDQGAVYVCNSSSPTFAADLTRQLEETGATLAFDAIGGGTLAGQILAGMEAVLARKMKAYSRYGSTTHKQVYIYGALDTGPTVLKRNFGFAFGIGGWLLFPYLEKIGAAATRQLQERIVAEIKTTFASHYSREISLVDALQPGEIAAYSQRATGAKFLIRPNRQ